MTQFTYLGTKITSSGNFKQGQEHLRDKALCAFAALSKKLNLTEICPRVCNKIFDAFIAPILTYNAEVWGAYENVDFVKWDKSPIEKAHLRYCKSYLGINRKSSNLAARSELGRFPIETLMDQKILNYFIHLNFLNDNSLCKQALNLSYDLSTNHKTFFYASVAGISPSGICPTGGEIPSDLAPPLGISPPFLNFRDFGLLRFRSCYFCGQKER